MYKHIVNILHTTTYNYIAEIHSIITIYKYIVYINTYIVETHIIRKSSNIIELVCNGFMYRNTMHWSIELKQYIDMLVIMSLHVDLEEIYNILSFMKLYFHNVGTAFIDVWELQYSQ